jgi:hypothetical protein
VPHGPRRKRWRQFGLIGDQDDAYGLVDQSDTQPPNDGGKELEASPISQQGDTERLGNRQVHVVGHEFSLHPSGGRLSIGPPRRSCRVERQGTPVAVAFSQAHGSADEPSGTHQDAETQGIRERLPYPVAGRLARLRPVGIDGASREPAKFWI